MAARRFVYSDTMMRMSRPRLLLLITCALWLSSCNVVVVAMASSTANNPSRRRLDLLGLGSHFGAAISAAAEVMEDVESIGHGHGMLLLGGSKLCREFHVMQEAVFEAANGIVINKSSSKYGTILRRPFKAILELLGSTYMSVGLALAGLTAAIMEVFQDARPGGHHGLIFLAINELLEMLETSRIISGGNRIHKAIENQVLRLVLVSSATVFASLEAIRSVKKCGAHHGVLLLGLSKTLRCIGLMRSRFVNEKED